MSDLPHTRPQVTDSALRRAGAVGPDAEGGREQGLALILVMIVVVLIYVIVAELVITGKLARLTGDNEALLTRMQFQSAFTLQQIEEDLLADLEAAAAEDGEGGEAVGGGAAPDFAGAAPGGDLGDAVPDPAGECDGSRDTWFAPQAYGEDDITIYAWVEDENRKFNVLQLLSPDEEFRRAAKDRFVRLIDNLREDTEFDVGSAEGEQIARELIEWMEARTRTEDLPRAPMKSDPENPNGAPSPILHMDELLMLPSVNESLFFDKVWDGVVIPGLESVLTCWTSLAQAPAPPDPETPAASTAPVDPQSQTVLGEGTRININTAHRAVLRSLIDRSRMPDLVIDAILRYRNEPDEEALEAMEGDEGVDGFEDVRDFEEVPFQVFTSLDQLEEIPEFANLSDPDMKTEFTELLTTNSDVFSVHLSALHIRNAENRVYVLRRFRSVLFRQSGESGGTLYPIVLMEDRRGLRAQWQDFLPDENQRNYAYLDVDALAAEERANNPFLVEFYLPDEDRKEFYDPSAFR